jgi:hypothetical protein
VTDIGIALTPPAHHNVDPRFSVSGLLLNNPLRSHAQPVQSILVDTALMSSSLRPRGGVTNDPQNVLVESSYFPCHGISTSHRRRRRSICSMFDQASINSVADFFEAAVPQIIVIKRHRRRHHRFQCDETRSIKPGM